MKLIRKYISTSPLLSGHRRIHDLTRHWATACASAGLTIPLPSGKHQPPTLTNLQIADEFGNVLTAYVDTSTIHRTARYFEDRFDILVATFSAEYGNVERLSPSTARITLEWDRPKPKFTFTQEELKNPNLPHDISGFRIDLDKARNANALLGLTTSTLISGQSESGKSNLAWHLLNEINRSKIPTRLSVVDPAGGVELNNLRESPLTRRYVDRAKDVEGLIQKFHADLEKRLNMMQQNNTRTHNPSQAHPLEIMVIDELLLCGSQLKGGVLSPIGEILAVGRKARFIVWGLTQLGQKEVIGQIRDLFPQRVCFATRTQEATDAALGSGATAEGAKCHGIHRPGQGYVWTDHSGSYQKFQAPLISQDDTLTIASGGVAQ